MGKRKFEGITADVARKMRDEGEHVRQAIATIEDMIGEAAETNQPISIDLNSFSKQARENIENEFKSRGFNTSLLDLNGGDDYNYEDWELSIDW